jgi:hypothetical protein
VHLGGKMAFDEIGQQAHDVEAMFTIGHGPKLPEASYQLSAISTSLADPS